MTLPVWVLLGFAGWTLLILFSTIGVYRWFRIFAGKAMVADWRADEKQGTEWYQRAMRAHANCVENLPVYGAIVLAAVVSGTKGEFVDFLALAFLIARISQTSVHLLWKQTNFVASIRFACFFTQAFCMVTMAITISVHAIQ
jgi:uncharacterized MAPEG superfamily protein